MSIRTYSWNASRLGLNLPLALLIGQSVALGTLLSLLIIPGSALFLPTFGSGALAYVYIVVAILGSAVFYGFGELQRRLPLTTLSVATIGLIVAYFILAWLGLTIADLGWIPFALMASFSLIIQMGFVILGAQAGRLFDVRQVKRQFPRIVAGFVTGFLLGGFIAPRLGRLLGSTEDVLLGAATSAGVMLIFLIITIGRFRDRLQAATPVQTGPDKAPSKPLWQLLTKRFVLLVVAYQMLSAMASQLLDFALLDQAALRFTDSESLAQFFGDFAVWVNLSDLLFLLVLAGLLLSRYGLRLGLLTNPLVDGLILVLEIAAGLILGISSATFFWLVAIVRIIDITLSDGTTRGSINTAYQALPPDERVPVQTAVEGIGVPLALGLTGVALIIFNAFSGLNILHIVIFTLFITLLWGLAAVLFYRDYSAALTQTLRRRALSPAELTLDDSSSLAAVMVLLEKDNLHDVVLGLDMLEAAGTETLDQQLIHLTSSERPDIRAEVLARIERRQLQEALPAVERLLEEEEASVVKGAALRTYAALRESEALDRVAPYLENADPELRLGASIGLLHYGGIPGVLAVGEHLSILVDSADPAERRFVAQVIGGVGLKSFYQPLVSLIVDPDPDVRRAALDAAEQVRHPRLLPKLIETLDLDVTRSRTFCALSAYGQDVLPYVARALSADDEKLSAHANRLARLAGQIGGEDALKLLRSYIGHPDGEIRTRVLAALSICGFHAGRENAADILDQLETECAYAGRLLVARRDIGYDEAMASLESALNDEMRGARARIFYLLSFIYDPGATLQANQWLESRPGPARALALEMLDVNLESDHKHMLFPLVDTQLSLDERAEALGKRFSLERQGRERWIISMIGGIDEPAFGSWVRACAIYAAGRLNLAEAIDSVEASLQAPEAARRETAAWALHRLDPDRFQSHIQTLVNDPSPQVVRLVARLSENRGED